MIQPRFPALLSSALIVASTIYLASGQQPARPAPTDRAADAESLYTESLSSFETGRHRAALMKLFEAVSLWEQSRRNDRAIEALLRAGESYREAERWQHALQCYKRLLKFPSLPPQTKVAALNSTAALYLRFHQFHLAGDYFRRSLDAAKDQKDLAACSIALAGLAAVCADEGKKHQSQDYLSRAQTMARQSGSREAEAEMLLFIGQIWRKQGQTTQARQAFEDALSFYRQSKSDQQKQSLLLCFLSDLHLASDPAKALACAAEALNLSKPTTSGGLRWRAYIARARAQRAMGEKEKALSSYWLSYSQTEKERFSLSVDAFRVALLEDQQAAYRELSDMLIEEGNLEEAFKVAENARARATLDLIAQKRAGKEPPSTSDQGQSLEEISKKISSMTTKWRSDQLNPQQKAQLEEELKKAESEREEIRFENEMNRLHRFTATVNLKQAQDTLRAGEVLIEFFLGENRSHVWLISKERFACVTLPARKEIEESVQRYTTLLARRPNSFRLPRELAEQKKMASELFDMLLGKLADKFSSARRLRFAPDGLLYYLPFETLVSANRYLVEQYDIDYTPSASVLAALEKSKLDAQSDGRIELIAFGDPDFGPPGAAAGAEALSGSWVDYRLQQLPGTNGEVVSISNLFPSDQRRVYLGRAATEDALKRESLTRCRRLHFATHGLIDERFPSRSGILLTLDRDPTEDGFLDTEEIAGLEMHCELVVLSACQTGRGRLTGGEGVVGLARAFLYAGARSVVVSLWSVSDISAASLMRRFYQQLAAKRGPVASLRQAKMEMIRSDKAERHPYYWSPFLIVGQSE